MYKPSAYRDSARFISYIKDNFTRLQDAEKLPPCTKNKVITCFWLLKNGVCVATRNIRSESK